MSARLKLKKLKFQMECVRDTCKRREAEARYEKNRCYNLLQKNILEIEAITTMLPVNTYRAAITQLDSNVHAVADAIVRKYTEQLAEYVRNQLTSKYMFNKFATFGVRLLAPALTEDHINIDIKTESL